MAKKRKADNVPPPGATATPPADRHTSPRVVFYMPAELLAALDEQADVNDRTRTAELIRAVKSYLTGLGAWPRRKEGGE